VFDGRYIYYVPDQIASGSYDGRIARYDTQGAYAALTSWSAFDITTVSANAKGFDGGTFDGRYVYLVPYDNASGTPDGVVARYDTQAAFNAAGSWATFNVATVNANAKGFAGGIFDGRYVYLVPYYDITWDGLVTRYDTQAAFAAAGSWQTFDTTTVNASASGFQTAAFDGRYVYLVPLNNGASTTGPITRYDTQQAFTSASSWQTFDTTTLDASAVDFTSAQFDGRYVYFVPEAGSILVRYDTLGTFTAAAAWETFDTTTIDSNGSGFTGSVFDGEYIYLEPFNRGIALRFVAKTASGLPQLCASAAALHCYAGSFY